MRVPSHTSVSKCYADKTYANLWFILLKVTKDFRFQKNKNVRFISGNFSSDRFSWIKYDMVYIFQLIYKHLQYRCLEFTILKRTWRIIAKKINFSLEFRIKSCKILVHHTVSFHWLNIIYWAKHFISWDKTTNLSPRSTYWISNQWQIPENYNSQRTTRARERSRKIQPFFF